MDPYPYLDTTKIQSGNELFHHYRIMETSDLLKTPLDIKVQSLPSVSTLEFGINVAPGNFCKNNSTATWIGIAPGPMKLQVIWSFYTLQKEKKVKKIKNKKSKSW